MTENSSFCKTTTDHQFTVYCYFQYNKLPTSMVSSKNVEFIEMLFSSIVCIYYLLYYWPWSDYWLQYSLWRYGDNGPLQRPQHWKCLKSQRPQHSLFVPVRRSAYVHFLGIPGRVCIYASDYRRRHVYTNAIPAKPRKNPWPRSTLAESAVYTHFELGLDHGAGTARVQRVERVPYAIGDVLQQRRHRRTAAK